MTAVDVDEKKPRKKNRVKAVTEAARNLISRNGRSLSSFPNEGPSSHSVHSAVTGLMAQYAPLGYLLPWEVMEHVELLSTFNPDYSQAVDNIRSLANSGHELFIDADSDLRQRRIKERYEEKARTIQEPHGGIDGVIDKLLDQGATYGAMCGEWVLDEDLTDVIDFVDINPKYIRYFWDEDLQRHIPFQKLQSHQIREAEDRGQEVRNGCARLNELTFRYFAFDAAPQSPYGTPPFVASLVNIAIQRDMVHNMAQIVKKLGLLGIVDMSIESLPSVPGETDEKYAERAGKYLDDYAKIVEEMVRDGGIVHFDDAEIKVTSMAGNAAGATNIFKQNEELIFSGLKSMPSVQGRSYSTTETYAGVAYDIIIRNTRKYQRACKRMIESGYWLMSSVWGGLWVPNSVNIRFNENKTLQRLQMAQAEQLEIRNGLVLWANGIVDQDGFAQRLGFSEPKVRMEWPGDMASSGGDVPRPSDQGP